MPCTASLLSWSAYFSSVDELFKILIPLPDRSTEFEGARFSYLQYGSEFLKIWGHLETFRSPASPTGISDLLLAAAHVAV